MCRPAAVHCWVCAAGGSLGVRAVGTWCCWGPPAGGRGRVSRQRRIRLRKQRRITKVHTRVGQHCCSGKRERRERGAWCVVQANSPQAAPCHQRASPTGGCWPNVPCGGRTAGLPGPSCLYLKEASNLRNLGEVPRYTGGYRVGVGGRCAKGGRTQGARGSYQKWCSFSA